MEYLSSNSPIHRLNPLTKLIALVVIFTLGIIFSNLGFLLILIGVIYLLFLVAGANRVFITYARLLGFASIFMMVLQILFAHDGPELFRFIPSSIPVFGWIGAINQDSLLLGLVMVARMGVFGLSLPLLLTTTQSRDLVLTLVERLKLPFQYAFMFITALRFIPTLFEEIENIIQAQKARAFEMKSKNPIKQAKAYIPLITPLVMIALKKAERLAIAMETRGYGSGPRTYLQKPTFGVSDYATCAGCCVIMILMISLKLFGRIM
ncbi:MAG TPA: energy-coupling factor transporter transmembrane component T [Bacillota bacterium]|nr:energy-coupling factor transporter transmembrane component T [Bacillota bacterium]